MSAHRSAQDISHQAVRIAGEARAAYLDEACAGDSNLRAQVEALIAAHEGPTLATDASNLSGGGAPVDTVALPRQGGGSSGTAAAASFDEAPLREGPGSRIGPYRLLQQIGEGGFGTVFVAEQEKPVARKVALKIIKLGMDTRQVVARFEQERQALALMDHPGIAKVLDAGATDTGRPYFVMELVKGEPITDYCDKNSLSMAERLSLFKDVCHAVQHAHTKGIIHRDIKPTNVLVTVVDGKPMPKVIDFGVAKATSARLTERTLFTEHRALIGTPEYMSPEQAEMTGVDIDTRTDVYSLGVLLYQLLTGTTPFDSRQLRSAAYDQIQRIIREVDPPKPSTRLSTLGEEVTTIAARRRTEPRKLGSLIRGELDWIVMKAMEKDRTRRYDTASALAADIARYLAQEPVEAGPPSAAYRVRKLVRRNRGVVAIASAAAALLIAATAFSGVQAVRARRAEAAARAEAAKARAVSEFLSDMLSSADPAKARGRELSIADVIDEAAGRLSEGGGSLTDQPEVRATLLRTIGTTYFQLGRYADAETHLATAHALSSRTLGAEHPSTLTIADELGAALLYQRKLDAAEKTLRATLDSRRRLLGDDDPDTMTSQARLALLLQDEGRLDEAERLHRTVIDAKKRVLGPNHRATIESMLSFADLLEDAGKLEEALETAVAASDAAERALGGDDLLTLNGRSIQASILQNLGRYEQAETLTRTSLAIKARIFGEGHPETMTTANVLALTLERSGKSAEAMVILEKIAASAEKALGPDHDTTLTYYSNLARQQHIAGRLDEAEALFRLVLDRSIATRDPDDRGLLTVQNNLALLLMDRGKHAEAEPLFRGTFAGLKRSLEPGHWIIPASELNLGDCLMALGRYEESEATMLHAYEGLKAALGDAHDRTRGAAKTIAQLYEQWEAAAPGSGRGAKAAEWLERSKPTTP